MDKATCKALGVELAKATEEIAKRHGMKAVYKGGNYDATSTILKIEFAEADAAGTVMTREAQEFKEMAQLYGLEASDLGRGFTVRGEHCTVVGLASKSRKFPVIVRTPSGLLRKCSADYAKAMLGHNQP